MKYLVINASTKGKRSMTMKVTTRFLDGIRSAQPEANIEIIHLAEEKIYPCKSCFSCWSLTQGRCRQNSKSDDTFEEIAQKYIEADRLIISTPIQFFNCSSMFMNFLERTISLSVPVHLQKEKLEKGGEQGLKKKYGNMWTKETAVISTCFMLYEGSYDVFDTLFSRLTRGKHQGIYLPQPVRRSATDKTFLEKIFAAVEEMGTDFAKDGVFREASRQTLRQMIANLLENNPAFTPERVSQRGHYDTNGRYTMSFP